LLLTTGHRGAQPEVFRGHSMLGLLAKRRELSHLTGGWRIAVKRDHYRSID